MKNAPIFLIGLFVALLVSFGGIVLGSNAQLGSLTPYFDTDGGGAYPERASGLASRGQLVYADLGCAACHTQQVRRPDFGSDQARGWGERQSVARDYIHQIRPQIGASRFGPDLANLAGRKSAPTADDLMNLLYNGSPTHPSYRFLFDVRETHAERSSRALNLTGRAVPAMGFEVVPTERAQSLVAFLLSLNTGFDYPEARPVAPEPKAGHAAAPAGKHEEKPVPAAAPDEKKKEGAK
jgi:cytochrome c oxidase cbb3-type subunit 2